MADVEKNAVYNDSKAGTSPTPAYGNEPTYESYETSSEIKQNVARRVWDSFKRDPNATATPSGAVGADGHVFQPESSAVGPEHGGLQRKLKGRHLQMIAIGGSIGKGILVISIFLLDCELTFSQVLVFSLPLVRHFPLVDQLLSSSPSVSLVLCCSALFTL